MSFQNLQTYNFSACSLPAAWTHPDVQITESIHQIKTVNILKSSLLNSISCGPINFADKLGISSTLLFQIITVVTNTHSHDFSSENAW